MSGRRAKWARAALRHRRWNSPGDVIVGRGGFPFSLNEFVGRPESELAAALLVSPHWLRRQLRNPT